MKKLIFNKKIILYFMICISCFQLLVQNIFATNNYLVHIAVFCDDELIGKSFIDNACKHTYIERPLEVVPTEEINKLENCTVVLAEDIDTNYHIQFHLIPKSQIETYKPTGLSSLIKQCSGAIIIYDISDPALLPVVQSNNFYKHDVEKLLNTLNIPLINYINYLQGFLRKGWFNSINFVTYGKDKLSKDDYDVRHEQVNRFTCEVEPFFKIDNKWGRGHPDVTYPRCFNLILRWASGAAYRSIGEGIVSGKFKDTEILKKKSNFPIKRVTSGILVVSSVAMVFCGLHLLNKK